MRARRVGVEFPVAPEFVSYSESPTRKASLLFFGRGNYSSFHGGVHNAGPQDL